jgi:hypothetical protein
MFGDKNPEQMLYDYIKEGFIRVGTAFPEFNPTTRT